MGGSSGLYLRMLMKNSFPALRAVSLSLVYLLSCAVLATGLAYPLHLMSGGSLDIRVAVTRGSLILVILGSWFWVKRLRLDRHSLGFGQASGSLRLVLQWFARGVLMLGLHCVVLVMLGLREPDWPVLGEGQRVMTGLLQALGIGFLVATIEEIIFRGILLAALQRSAGTLVAILCSALYYAILHFFRVDRSLVLPEPSFYSSFSVLNLALHPVFNPPPDSSLALFFAGLFLAVVRLHKPNGLACCVGLHAGWVFVIKSFKTLTDGHPESEWAFLVGSYDGFIGYLAAGWMGVVTLLLLVRSYRNPQDQPGSGSS